MTDVRTAITENLNIVSINKFEIIKVGLPSVAVAQTSELILLASASQTDHFSSRFQKILQKIFLLSSPVL